MRGVKKMILRKSGRKIRERRSLLLTSLFFFFFTGVVVGAQYSPLIKNQTWRLTGKINELDYCQLVQDKELFHKTTVRVKARIASDGSHLYLYGCTTGVSANFMVVAFDDATSLSEEAKQWLQQLQEQGKERTVSSGAWFTGQFNGKWSAGCYVPAFALNIKSIENLEPISFEPEDPNGVPIDPNTDGPPIRRYH
jgi:hypothetical protein